MDQVTQILRRQRGLITATQARGAGLTYRQLDYRVSSGEWRRHRNGVYLLATTPVDWDIRLRSAVLGRKCVVSGPAASVLWGLEVFREPMAEITVPHGALHDPKVIVRKTSQWSLRSQVTRRGMPTTGIERTVIDCASTCSLDTVERLSESAIRQGLTTWLRLGECAAQHAGPGRIGPANFARLITRRRDQLEVARSDFSLRARQLLVGAGLPEPVLEYQVTSTAGEHLLYLDVAWPEHKKAWELDSRKWHSGIEHFENDRRKRNSVKAHGWAIQEITWRMFEQPSALIDLARAFLAA